MIGPHAKVSILVPTYNVADYLDQCLDSLAGQTLRDIEIVIIDDGSTDASGAIADKYAAKDKRFIVVHKENSGYGDSMNQGLAIASAPWIAICEPDDYAEPSMCEHLLRHAERFSRAANPVDVVKASYTRVLVEQDGSTSTLPSPFHEIVDPPHQPFSIDSCPALLTAHPSIWTALYRRAFLDEFGIRFRPIPGAGWADNPFFIETMLAARRIAWLDEPVYNYREFEDGTISHLKDWRIIVDRWAEMDGVFERYDAKSPILLEAHSVRGCAYLQMLNADFDRNDDELAFRARKMAQSLDFNVIRHSSMISKEYKLAYARHLPSRKRLALFASWTALQVRSVLRRLIPYNEAHV